jgi:hypothetical protein
MPPSFLASAELKEFIIKKNIFIALSIAAATAFWAGCGLIGGTTGILSSETRSEKVTSAEFNLAKTDGNVVVVVSQPAWVKAPFDMRMKLTDAVNAAFEEKAKIKKDRLIPYANVQKCRMELPDEKREDPFEIASKLNAQYLLAVQITDFELNTFAEEDLFNGMMITKSCLFDANRNKMWPQDANEGFRQTAVGFEDEKSTVELAVSKLTAAAAHCITRYLYNCKTEKFRIPEEQKELDFYNW